MTSDTSNWKIPQINSGFLAGAQGMDGNGVAGIITHNYHGSFPIFPTFSTSKILRCRESGQAHVALPVEVGAAPRSAEAGGAGRCWVSRVLEWFYVGFNGKRPLDLDLYPYLLI